MNSSSITDWKPRHGIVLAHSCCLCLGLGLMFWGLAPAVIERIISGEPPDLLMLGMGSASLLLGITFIGLHLLIRKGARWALWAAYLVSLGLVAMAFAITVFSATRMGSLFLLLLSSWTAFAAWLALRAGAPGEKETLSQGPRAPRSTAPPARAR